MPLVYLILCFCFIGWLFFVDIRSRKAGSGALWIPGLWLLLTTCRPLGYWLGGFGSSGNVEGNPINLLTQGALLFAALCVIQARRCKWSTLLWQNKALFLVYGYLLFTVLWSPLPFVSMKRLFRDFGCVLALLIFLLEDDPLFAIKTVFTRVAFFVLPLSLVVGKYFPSVGRVVSDGGEFMFAGLTMHKNSLGQAVVVFGLIILWDLIDLVKSENFPGRKLQIYIRGGMLFIGVWILSLANSATANACFGGGAVIFFFAGYLAEHRYGRRILVGGLALAAVIFVLDQSFSISEEIITALGRDITLTGRTEIWNALQNVQGDKILGYGFAIFWDTPAALPFFDQMSNAEVNTAHNGYLEMILDGGYIGLAFLALMILAAGKKAINKLFNLEGSGRVAVVFWLVAAVYNYTESDFFRMSPLWSTFMLLTMNYNTGEQQIMTSEVEDEDETYITV